MGKQRFWNANGAFNNGENQENEPTSSPGCMCAVFQLFDFHLLNQNNQQTHSSSSSFIPISLPHGNLISAGTEAPRNSLESEVGEDDDLQIPMSVVQIKTKSGKNTQECFSSNSPSTKTPTLVARLMGLDLLPQSNSPSTTPRTSSLSPINHHHLTPPPLPESPRTSYERKSSLQNHHHKENTSPNKPRKVKQTLSRKPCLDITNYTTRDEVFIQTKPRKVSQSSRTETRKPSAKTKQKVKTAPHIRADGDRKMRSKKDMNDKFGRPVKIVKNSMKKEEPFFVPLRITTKAYKESSGKKCRKNPLSNNLLNFSTSSSTVFMKKEPSISPAKVPQMQFLQLSRFQNQPHKAFHEQDVTKEDVKSDVAIELAYVRKILNHTSSSSSPLYSIEEQSISKPDTKLLSHLVGELLTCPASSPVAGERWPEVVEKLCEKVRRFPRAKCHVLEDIDGIIEKDLDKFGIHDEEWIVKEIEEAIVEELVTETAGLCCVLRDTKRCRFGETEMTESRRLFT